MLTLVRAEQFATAQIIIVATGAGHSVAMGAEGRVWTWGHDSQGQLGYDKENRFVPSQLADEAFSGAVAMLVAVGGAHIVAVTSEGALWAWGKGNYGQLGLGDEANRMIPARVGAEEAFGGSQVLTADCSDVHTMIVTKDSALFSCGRGAHGALGHNDANNRLVQTRVEAQHFGNANIISTAAGPFLSSAVTEEGALYTWGARMGLGHVDGQHKLVPTPVASHLLQGARVGRCHNLPPMHALAFVMGTHTRLGIAAPTAAAPGDSCKSQRDKAPAAADNGNGCEYVTMPGELVQRVVEACVSWPEGRVGELEGLVG